MTDDAHDTDSTSTPASAAGAGVGPASSGDPFADASLPGTVRDGYVFPAYGDRCFASVPGTVGDVFGVDVGPSLPGDVLPGGTADEASTVLVVLLDGFGWDRFSDHRESVPFLRSLTAAGETTPLTSVYPSETAAAITTMHTGATPNEHGLLGWNLLLREHGLTCMSLPFTTRDGESLADAVEGDIDGTDLFDAEPVYSRLADAGVECHTVQAARVTEGPYSEAAMAGAERHGCDTLAEWALTVRRRVEAAAESDQPTYVYAYWSEVDGAAHDEGTTSALYDGELAAVCGALERELGKLSERAASRTLACLTADHGHHDATPAEAVDLETIPEVWDARERHPTGEPVLPTGGPRNLHLHLRDGAAVQRVRGRLGEADFEARVLTGTEALEAGLFGPGEPSDLLRERIGDLVVVPRTRNVWFDGERRKLEFVGTHGGQHPAEMYVPFVATDLGEWLQTR